MEPSLALTFVACRFSCGDRLACLVAIRRVQRTPQYLLARLESYRLPCVVLYRPRDIWDWEEIRTRSKYCLRARTVLTKDMKGRGCGVSTCRTARVRSARSGPDTPIGIVTATVAC